MIAPLAGAREEHSRHEVPSQDLSKRDIVIRYYWGVVLISLGIVVMVFNPFDKLDAYLRGAANTGLTATLLGLAALTIAVALWAQSSLKALLILWILAP